MMGEMTMSLKKDLKDAVCVIALLILLGSMLSLAVIAPNDGRVALWFLLVEMAERMQISLAFDLAYFYQRTQWYYTAVIAVPVAAVFYLLSGSAWPVWMWIVMNITTLLIMQLKIFPEWKATDKDELRRRRQKATESPIRLPLFEKTVVAVAAASVVMILAAASVVMILAAGVGYFLCVVWR